MISKSLVSFVLLAVLANGVDARMRTVERDGRALYGRRFGQEQNPAISELSSACNGAVCGVLAGKAVGTLLAASPECAQQDLADDIIDAAREQDATTQAKMIDIAKRFRQAEKNTPPDFTTNPPTNRNSVFCQTAPRNSELVGLNQAQDPANNADDFFDPACKCTVKKGSQANTSPLASGGTSGGNQTNKNGNNGGGNASSSAAATGTATETGAATETGTATETGAATEIATTTAAASETATATATSTDAAATTTAPANNDPANTCPAVPTVTVTVDPSAPTATATGVVSSASASADSSATGTTAAPAATAAPANGNINLGSCSDPTLKFGAGIEGRKETSFIPNNLKEFNHGSAQNSAIITQFVCDTFVNSCKANQAAIDACKQAKDAAAAAGAKKGAAADAFNAVFGVTTNFAAIQALDDQGRAVA